MMKITIDPRGNIGSVMCFVSQIPPLVAADKLWYRGLSSSGYDLKPSIGRTQKYAGRKLDLNQEGEINLLHRFRRRAYPHFGRTLTAGEAIFIARHYGLPTRLLDWTANALVALNFACSENPDKDGTVWAMQIQERTKDQPFDAFKLAKCEEEKELFDDYKTQYDEAENKIKPGATPHPSAKYAIKVIHPFYNSPRLVAQDGIFTLHYDPWHSIEHYKYDDLEFVEDCLDIEKLYSWTIPEAAKVNILKELIGLGITKRTVYPDLDGIAQSLWQTEVLFKGAIS
jgi:hypothetical protein